MAPQHLLVQSVESLTPDATARLITTIDPPGEKYTARVRFTPRADYRGPMYAMVMFHTTTGDWDVAFLARVLPPGK